ncbi:uncharacterized protein LOC131310969 [Rhododendron vialii]|uniref:uncharacterized protein LOC131310969 n=1 Tax=Rhododendron vialii TaxID=182163 RepID=UPI00265EEB71|nr:uncharacterized protein LOC131310969 [Rhododendron vialii]
MGNAAASCAPSIICSSTGAVKVLFSDGTLEIYTRPVMAGELMLQNPGHFVCDSSHLKVGHRIPGLLAEEELDLQPDRCRHGQQRGLYYLLPMEMLYSVLTNEELNSLNDKACKALKQQGTGGINGYLSFPKIFPAAFGEFCLFPNDHSETKTTLYSESVAVAATDSSHSRQRSWTPALETILETPPRRLIG